VGDPLPLGLRVDVDTHEGMRDGVPSLLDAMAAAGVHATFYLSMGPDNSGRAVFNLLRPGFFAKMRRTGAVRVYGLRTVLSGTLLPARPIGLAFPAIARRIRAEGHEVGVHAWNHRRWQDRLFRLRPAQVAEELRRGREAYVSIFGEPPRTFAAPAWLSSDASLLAEEALALEFGSDCRGVGPFAPVIGGATLQTPQVPTTLPTLDEALGNTHDDARAFFASVLADLRPGGWPVLTIHAEIEGGPYREPFVEFLAAVRARQVRPVTLGALLAMRRATSLPLPCCPVLHAPVPGRHGVVSMQGAPR
jgi:undecaprenyl phosphate-alpha-L-ara4FN deformylase